MINITCESSRAHKTTILINSDDWNYIQSRHLKPTALLRIKIHELKTKGEGVNWENQSKLIGDKLNKIFEAMQKNLSAVQIQKVLKAAAN